MSDRRHKKNLLLGDYGMNRRRYEERGHGHRRGRIVFGVPVILSVIGAFTALGYLITTRLFGGLNPLMSHIVSSLIGILLLALIIWTFGAILRRGKKEEFVSAHETMLEALDQIAHGNFNVLINPDGNVPHHDIAHAINEMAKNLGSLETMRQDFISNVSHEIQSPLTSIGGFAALLQKDELTDEDRRHYAAIIKAESQRLSSLSDNLLKLSALDGEPRPLSLKEFRLDKQLEHIALATEPQWSGKNINLEVELPKCQIYGDEYLLSQVWTNLLHNAIKFTRDGGSITMVLAIGGNGVSVMISDTGPGIVAEDQIHIFERFYKVDKSRDRSLGGNGLGLALCKRIVELHGGSVTVESAVGVGAKFTVTLSRHK